MFEKSPQKHGFIPVRSACLDNGLNVFVNERPAAPVVSVQLWVRTGSIHEQEYLGCGLSHFLEHMLFQGCTGYPGQSAADHVHKLGGDFNAYTSFGCTVYYIDLPANHASTAIKILSSMVSQPEFPEEKFISEKEVILRERDMGRDNPSRQLSEKLWLNMFKVHPVRHPIIGYHELITSVDRDIMANYYRRRYSPLRSFFVIAGDVDSEEMFSCASSCLGSWKIGCADEPALPQEPSHLAPSFSEFSFPDPLCRLAIGFRTPEATHPDTPVLDVISGIVGMNRSSRLVNRFRIKESLALQIGAMNYSPYFCGMFGISAAAMPENLEKLEAGIIDELDSICKVGVDDEEVERERMQQSAEYLRLLTTASGVARLTGESVLSCGSPKYPETYFKLLDQVTPERVRLVAREYFKSETVTVVRMLSEEKKKVGKRKKNRKNNVKKPVMTDDNGTRLIMLQDKTMPLIDLCVILPGGTILEKPENSGITKLTAALLPTGCDGMTEEQINNELDNNAIELSTTGGANTLMLRMNFRSECFERASELFTRLVTNPTFGIKEFEREKGNMAEALKSRSLNPQSAAEDEMIKNIFGDHPYSMPKVGTVESVKKITCDDVKNFYNEICMSREKVVFGIAGDFDKKQARRWFKTITRDALWSDIPSQQYPPVPKFPAAPVKSTVLIPREQAVVMLAVPGCDNNHKDRFALDILQEAVNGQAAALFKSIREEAGLAYYTGMYSMRGIRPGFLTFYAGTKGESVEQVIVRFEAEKSRLVDPGLEEAEFAAAREAVIFNLTKDIQQSGRYLAQSSLSEFYGNGFDSVNLRLSVFNSITRDQVNRVIKRYMSEANTVISVAMPEERF